MRLCVNMAALLTGSLVFCMTTTTLADHAQLPGVKVESLLSTSNSWDGTAYGHYPSSKPEVSVLRYSIPAHTTLPWHSHAIPNVAYIVSGQITVEKQSTGETRVFRAGEALAEMVDSPHRGYTGAEPAELVVFYAGAEGLALVTREDEKK